MSIESDPCKPQAGHVAPVVKINHCSSKGDCIKVCPYDVFEMQSISVNEYEQLNFVGRLKTFLHGNKKAVVKNPEMCHSCGLCVTACPEKAIKLTRLLA